MPPKSEDKAVSKKGPGHFLVRNTGEVVPLIAVDELPIGLEIKGVPRSLDLTDTVGMLNLGLVRNTHHFYEVERKDAVKQEVAKTVAEPVTTTVPTSKQATPTTPAAPKPTPAGPPPFITSIPRQRAGPSNSIQTCKHWATHGICKWGQQCRYRHIMPMTHHGLHEAGLHDWPAWYRALNPTYFHDPVPARTQVPVPAPMGLASSMHAGGRGCAGVGCCDNTYSHAHGSRYQAAKNPRHFVTTRRREEPGEEVLERLRLHALAGKEAEREEERLQELLRKAGQKKRASGLIERASDRNARVWEEEESGSESGSGSGSEVKKQAVAVVAGKEEKEKGVLVKGKLVDV